MKNKTITQDIYFAAAMISLGAKLEDTDKSDPRHMKFSLSKENTIYTFTSPNIPSAVTVTTGEIVSIPMDFEYYEREWANGSLMVNATSFKDAIQRMKSVVHSS